MTMGLPMFEVAPNAESAPDRICGLTPGQIGPALVSSDLIVVSQDGGFDSRLGGLVQIDCTWLDYALLFPEVPPEVRNIAGIGLGPAQLAAYFAEENPEGLKAFLAQIESGIWQPSFENYRAGGVNTETNLCIAKDCSRVEPVCHEETCPEAPCVSDCELMIECDDIPCLMVQFECEDVDSCLDLLCERSEVFCNIHVSSTLTPVPASTSSTGDLTIVFPDQADAQSPNGRCNQQTTQTAVNRIMEQQSVFSLVVRCYDALTPTGWWMPSANGEVEDANTLLSSCDVYVNAQFGSVGGEWACWVREASRNGLRQGQFAFMAEHPSRWWYPDYPDVAITAHEIFHIHGATHFPNDGYKKYICNYWHWHWWGAHLHAWYSNMNYCYAGLHGVTELDSANRARLT